MSFGQSGWENMDDYESAGSGQRKLTGPKRFWLPAGVTKRILFLDDAPYTFYEHSLWAITKKSSDKAVCLKKNPGLGGECPLCDAEMWPSFTGFFSVIDMGDVKPGKKKVKSYSRAGRMTRASTSSLVESCSVRSVGARISPAFCRSLSGWQKRRVVLWALCGTSIVPGRR